MAVATHDRQRTGRRPDPSSPDFLTLAIDDCFGHASPDESMWLRSDDLLPHFHATLRALTAQLAEQLEDYRRGVRVRGRDADWHNKTRNLRRKVELRLGELGPTLKERNRRRNRSSEAARLLDAISAHRRATQRDNLEPTPADQALWAMLGSEG